MRDRRLIRARPQKASVGMGSRAHGRASIFKPLKMKDFGFRKIQSPCPRLPRRANRGRPLVRQAFYSFGDRMMQFEVGSDRTGESRALCTATGWDVGRVHQASLGPCSVHRVRGGQQCWPATHTFPDRSRRCINLTQVAGLRASLRSSPPPCLLL